MGPNWVRQARERVKGGLPWRGQLQGVAGCGRPSLTLVDRRLKELVSKDRQEIDRGKAGGRGILHAEAHKGRASGGEGLGWQDQREVQGMWGTAWTLQRLDSQPDFPRWDE